MQAWTRSILALQLVCAAAAATSASLSTRRKHPQHSDTFKNVEAGFGRTVQTIVEGETNVFNLPKLEFNNYANKLADHL